MEGSPRLYLGAAYTSASLLYNLSLDAATSCAALARAAARQAGLEPTATLELALPLPLNSHLLERAAMTGDRLLIQTAPPRPAPWQAQSDGQPSVTVQCGELEVSISGKTSVIVGKAGGMGTPDVDLSLPAAHTPSDFIAEQCLELRYQPDERCWYALRLGQTRARLDEFELSPRVPLRLSAQTQLQLYPPAGGLLPAERRLATLTIHAQAHHSPPADDVLSAGAFAARVLIGTEHPLGILELQGTLSVDTIARRALAHYGHPIPPRLRCYLLRLLPPDQPVGAALASGDTLFYLARDLETIRSVLYLRSADHSSVYTLYGSASSAGFQLGMRLQQNTPDPALDVDLYDLLPQPMPPSVLPHLGYVWVQFYYEPEVNAWWISSTAHPMPVFLDGRRLSSVPVRITDQRVLSIGIEGTALILRFVLALSAR